MPEQRGVHVARGEELTLDPNILVRSAPIYIYRPAPTETALLRGINLARRSWEPSAEADPPVVSLSSLQQRAAAQGPYRGAMAATPRVRWTCVK